MAHLNRVYGAIDEETALYELGQFAAKWDSKYPKISVSMMQMSWVSRNLPYPPHNQLVFMPSFGIYTEFEKEPSVLKHIPKNRVKWR